MKNIKRISSMALAAIFAMTSCNKFLDTLPDNRTELDSEEKVTKILVSAYPTTHYAEISELYSDNCDELAGTAYTPLNKLQEELATWADPQEKEEDSPFNLWNDSYAGIAACNAALETIEKMGNPESLQAQKGEALVARAYNHFILVNIFSKAYSPKTGTSDPGIPYAEQVESTVAPRYERGTVAETYQKIEKDILEGLPLIDDAIYSVNKYHFNRKAALAFATRFYLYYVQPDKSNYRKVIEYASELLTDNPSSMLRDWKTVGALTPNGGVRSNAFVNSSEKANLLLQSTNSLWARIFGPYTLGLKYTHGSTIADREGCRARGFWGTYSSFYFRIPSYGAGLPKVIMAKFGEFFEYSDPVQGIGYPHEMFPALTSDEALINRAEAYAMLSRYDEAAADLNTWTRAFSSSTATVSTASIEALYGDAMNYYTPTAPTPKKALNPDFTVEPGTQEAMVHAILHGRRLLSLHDGLRWFDIKRYGIKIYRRRIETDGKITVLDSLLVGDPRRAIQLPPAVIAAGLEANPR